MEDDLGKALKTMQPRARHHSLLEVLGCNSIKILLHMFNLFLASGNIFQIWHNDNIIPFLKVNKLPSDLESFRPVSLTSCVNNLL